MGVFGKMFVVLIAVAIVAAVALIEVEVPSINEVKGAVAYTQPNVTASFAMSLSGVSGFGEPYPAFDVDAGDVNQVTTALEVDYFEYVKPTPVMKPLWRIVLGANQLIGIPIGPGPTLPEETCTIDKSTSGAFDVDSFAKITVTAPGGEVTVQTTPTTTWKVEYSKQDLTCDDGKKKSSLFGGGAVKFEVGTYYFTMGWGTYEFQVEVFRAAGGATGDVKIGTLLESVDVTPEGAGS